MKYLLSIPCILLLSVGCSPKLNNQHIYWVNSSKKEYNHITKTNCFEVQKSEKPTEKWQLFYSSIEEFTYEPGYIYKLLVEEVPLKNTPTDGSSVKYKLVKVLEKNIDKRLKINDIWIVTSLEGKPLKIDVNQPQPQLEFSISEMRFTGNNGCNQVFGSIKQVTDSKLVLGEIASTRMACPNMEISRKVNQALKKVNSYQITPKGLILYDLHKNKLMQLKKVD